MKNSKILAALILAGMTAMATAQTNSPPNGGNGQGGESGGRKGPPPQAISACQGQSSGAPCSFVGRHNNSLTGNCYTPDANHPLACRPAQGAKHQAGQANAQGSGEQEKD